MDSKNEKKLIKPSGEKLLAVREEKLLRAPTFFEKHSMLRLSTGIAVLVGIILFGAIFAPSRFKSGADDENINILVTPIQENIVRYEPDTSLVSHVSSEGKFSIDYPDNYILDIKKDGKGTIQLSSEDRSGSYFKLLIEPLKLQKGLTLDQVIVKNPVCDPERTKNPFDSMINNSIPAKIYTDLDCLAQGRTLIRAVAEAGEDNMMYTFIIDSPLALDGFKNQLDEIMRSFRVIDSGNQPPVSPSPQEEAVFCTMDAMQCPDGSFVGRSGPKCEFICSDGNASAPEKPVDLNSGM